MSVALDDSTELAAELPSLKPVSVAPADQVECAVRAARADVARLKLQVRAIEHGADAAEVEAAAVGHVDVVDLNGTQEFLRAALEHRLTARRRELADEVARAREEATRLVSAAHSEAAALVDAARGDMLNALLGQPAVAPAPPGPHLRVVAPEPVARPAIPAEHPAAGATPPLTDPAVAELLQLLQAVVTPQVSEQVTTGATERVTPAFGAALLPPPALAPGQVAESRTKASVVARFMYLDVILPLVAVLIVIVVLLAWVG